MDRNNRQCRSPVRSICVVLVVVYIGRTDGIAHDARKTFLRSPFSKALTVWQSGKAVLVESANCMSIVQHYHKSMRSVFHVMQEECLDVSLEAVLQLVMKEWTTLLDSMELVPIWLYTALFHTADLPATDHY